MIRIVKFGFIFAFAYFSLDYLIFKIQMAQRAFTVDELVGFKGVPYKTENRFKKIQLNNYGFNDHDFTLQPDSLKIGINVLFIGDSLLMAVQVHREQNFFQLMQSNMPHDDIHFFNLGVQGYDYTQSFNTYLKYKNFLGADYVFYVFCFNDILTDDEQTFSFNEVHRQWLASQENSPILEILKTQSSKIFGTRNEEFKRIENDWYEKRSQNPLTTNLLSRFSNFLTQIKKYQNSNFAMIIVPPKSVIEKNQSTNYFAGQLFGELKSQNIDYIDLQEPMLKQSENDKKELFLDAIHLSEKGHALAARYIQMFVQKKLTEKRFFK